MKFFTHGEETRDAGASRTKRSLGRRICAMALAAVLVFELSATLPGGYAPYVSAEDVTFTYQPASMGLSVIPRDDVFSLAKLRQLESSSPASVLNINSLFSRGSYSNILGGSAPKISDTLSGTKAWNANFTWKPSGNNKVNSHLLNQAMDLEVFWSGSYTRTNAGDPSAQVWYYGNEDYLLIYGHSYDTLSIGRGPFLEKQGGAFSTGASGTAKSGATDAVPLSYNRISKLSRWVCEYDSKGRLIYERYTVNGVVTERPRTREVPYTEYHPTVAGTMLKIKPYMEAPQNHGSYTMRWEETPLNVTLSGAPGTVISDTKMRLRDNAAPFLNKITLKKNNSEVYGNAYIKSTDVLDILLEFNEDIRFADNAASDHGLKLRLSFVDSSNGTSDSDSWIEARLISLAGQTMTFRFDKTSSSGKTLPDEFYIDGIAAAAQTGWYSDSEDFPLSLIDAAGNTVVTGSSCCGIITDLAGNPFEKFNVTRFEDKARAYFDNLDPSIFKTTIWTTNLSQEEASSGLNPNETDPDKLFLKAGDKVSFEVIFSEELSSEYKGWQVGHKLKDKYGNELDPIATLNVKNGGNYVTLSTKDIYTVDSKTVAVDAASRALTVIEYEPLIITDGMTLDGSYIKITGINDLAKLCDLSLNDLALSSIPVPPYQQMIDITAPEITLGATVDDPLDIDVFTVPIKIVDTQSGTAGRDFQFKLSNNGEKSDYLWTVDGNETVIRREADGSTADTTGWTSASAKNSGWISVMPPIGASQMYLHVKIVDPKTWDYALSEVAGLSSGTKKTATSGSIEVKASDIKNNGSSEHTSFTHAVGQNSETVISIGSAVYTTGHVSIPVTVTNPIGLQNKIVWGYSENAMVNEVSIDPLTKLKTFSVDMDTDTSGSFAIYVGAYGPDGKANVGSASYSYNYEAGVLSYQTELGEEKAPLFGLPSISDMSVTANNRTMVLIDKGDGSFFATTGLTSGSTNLFAANSGLGWYTLTGTAAADYSSLTVSSSAASSADDVAAWLGNYYGKVTIVLLNQNNYVSNGEGGWGTDPGSYAANKGIVSAVEYAYLANGAVFTVTPGVTYSKDGTEVAAAVLAGSSAEPHSSLADYTFSAVLANGSDAASNQFYGLRLVDSAEAELYYKGSTGDYTSVRVVELPVGSTTKLSFTKSDGENTGWYKVVYRYTVNGNTTEAVIAEGVYLDSSSAIDPDIVSYNRSFDLYVREPMWKWGTYYTDYTQYTHLSAAADPDITDGEIVKIGVAPVEVPEDKLPEGKSRWNYSETPNSINEDAGYLDRYYLVDNEVNALTFSFTKTLPTAGT